MLYNGAIKLDYCLVPPYTHLLGQALKMQRNNSNVLVCLQLHAVWFLLLVY